MASPATYADLEALPPNQVGQIIGGELIAQPRPRGEHALAAARLIQQLAPFDTGPLGGWWILPEPELHLDADVVVPDLAGWRRERLERPAGAHFTLAPDWVCEILSPSTVALDRVRKMRVYGAAGVEHVWLVDPMERTLEGFRGAGERWLRSGGWEDGETVRSEPFAALELRLDRLWA